MLTIRNLVGLALAISLVGQAAALERQSYDILAGTDDAEQSLANGEMDITSSDLEIVDESDNQLVALRFTGINLKPGENVERAYIQFATDEPKKSKGEIAIQIAVEDSVNPATYADEINNLSNRPLMPATISWASEQAWENEHSSEKTPDLAELINQLTHRDDWQQGSAISFIFSGAGTRTAESFEGSQKHTDGLTDLAPKLIIEIAKTATIAVQSSVDDAEEDEAGSVDLTSSDLELVMDGSAKQTIGLRFASAGLPAGAEIRSAYLQFTVDEVNDDDNLPGELIIKAIAGDTQEFADAPFDITARETLVPQVTWNNISEWREKDAAGEDQRSPDISELVQALVNQPGWNSKSAVGFAISGTGKRVAESVDGSAAPELVVTYVGEAKIAQVDKIRVAWNSDPASTATIGWNKQASGDTYVAYQQYSPEQGCVEDLSQYNQQAQVDRAIDYRGMNNEFVELTNLAADTSYRFVVVHNGIASSCSWFKTAPATPKPFTFISGGDTKSSGNALTVGRWSNEMVAKLRPLFVLFTGDFNSDDGTNDAYWKTWLNDWSALTRSEDGRVYPIIAVHGNHEDGDMEMLSKLFGAGNSDAQQEKAYTYNRFQIAGDLFSLYTLNTQLFLQGLGAAHERQISWLDEQLAQDSSEFIAAGYHKPIRPHTLSKSENDHLLPWAALFEKYGVDVAFESDTHNHKITYPIVLDENGAMGFKRDDQNGVVYVGEGSWGATPRDNNDNKVWTLDSDAMNQIKWNQVFPASGNEPAKWEMRTVEIGRYINGELVNRLEGVAALTEENIFSPPVGITLYQTPVYGEVITLPWQTVQGDVPSFTWQPIAQAAYYSITLSWPELNVDARELELQRNDGSGWQLVSSTITPQTTSIVDDKLQDGTEYQYRLRAINAFGGSEWQTFTVSTLKDERLSASLIHGVNGYEGGALNVLVEQNADATFGNNDLLDNTWVAFDGATSDYAASGSGDTQGLLKFADLETTMNLPENAVIDEARLRFFTGGSSTGPIVFSQMLQDWDPATVTWNSLTNGLQLNGIEAVEQPVAIIANVDSDEYIYVDVTASLQSWFAGQPNYGWAIINQSTDGWDIVGNGYENADKPEDKAKYRVQLEVFYSVPQTETPDVPVNPGIPEAPGNPDPGTDTPNQESPSDGKKGGALSPWMLLSLMLGLTLVRRRV